MAGVGAAVAVLAAAVRFGPRVSRWVGHRSDEVTLLTALGLVLLVGGAAERVQVSAAVGAFLVGVAVSGRAAGQVHRLVGPLRDLFAAIFFLFFGLVIDPHTLPPVLPLAAGLAGATAATKAATGWWAARRAGAVLVARGEFSVVIAGLGAGLEPGPVPVAAYVLILAVLGPVLARAAQAVFPPPARPPG